jgi:hypothetical protein
MVSAARKPTPRLETRPASSPRYVMVICVGVRRSGRPCCRVLGELNPHHPYDLRYICRECGETYELRNP